MINLLKKAIVIAGMFTCIADINAMKPALSVTYKGLQSGKYMYRIKEKFGIDQHNYDYEWLDTVAELHVFAFDRNISVWQDKNSQESPVKASSVFVDTTGNVEIAIKIQAFSLVTIHANRVDGKGNLSSVLGLMTIQERQ